MVSSWIERRISFDALTLLSFLSSFGNPCLEVITSMLDTYAMKRILSSLCAASIITSLVSAESALDDQRKVFEAQLEKIAAGKSDAVSKLQDSYSKALERLAEKEQAAGNLDNLLAVKNEQARLAKDENVLPAGTKFKTEGLQELLSTYHDAEAKIMQMHGDETAKAAASYVESLELLERNLTKAGKVEEALAVRKEKERGSMLLNGNKPDGDYLRNDKSSEGDGTTIAGFPSKLTAGLILYHDFNSVSGDQVIDSSSTKSNGTIKGAKWVEDGRGKGNGVLQFDGSDSHVDLGDIYNDLDYPITVAAWINPDKFPNDWEPATIFQSDIKDYKHEGVTLSIGKRRMLSSKVGDGNGGGPGNRLGSMAEKILNTNEWVHVAMVWEGGGKDAIPFIDGKAYEPKVEGEAKVNKIVHSDKPAAVGWRWSGMLDDVAVWNRALTADEVKLLYKSTD